MKAWTLSPIVFFVYNRPWHARQTIEALQKNELAQDSELIIYSDGPKTEEDSLKVEEVRSYLKNVRGFAAVHIHEQKENQGLAQSIINGVTEMVNKYGRVIVLEDDLVTSPYFLKYMNEGLDLYDQDDRVISLLGYVYPVKSSLPETFFLKGAHCWGWATWKRGWDLFEKNGEVLLKKLVDQKLTKAFDCNGTYPYTEMLKAQIMGKNNSWGVRWNASAFVNDKLTLFPGRSLVFNIGNDGSGTHCGADGTFDISMAQTPIIVNKIEAIEHPGARKILENFYRTMQESFGTRLRRKMRKILKGML